MKQAGEAHILICRRQVYYRIVNKPLICCNSLGYCYLHKVLIRQVSCINNHCTCTYVRKQICGAKLVVDSLCQIGFNTEYIYLNLAIYNHFSKNKYNIPKINYLIGNNNYVPIIYNRGRLLKYQDLNKVSSMFQEAFLSRKAQEDIAWLLI